MAGMTHLQHAQPILLSHFLMAHAEAFARDLTRLHNAAASADACPMGSGALAGCSFAIDREVIARELGFSRITANSLDAVSDRDFALDYLFALAGIATHLSRLAEDFVLFASQEFSYAILPDEYSTGSSLMPQKKNPDAWELLRGKTGRITGALFSLFTTLKGCLPVTNVTSRKTRKPSSLLTTSLPRWSMSPLGLFLPCASTKASWLRPLRIPLYLLPKPPTTSSKRVFPSARPTILSEISCGRRSARQNPGRNCRSRTSVGFHRRFDADVANALQLAAALQSKNVPGGTAENSVRAAIFAARTKTQITGEQAMSLSSAFSIFEAATHRAEDRRSLP